MPYIFFLGTTAHILKIVGGVVEGLSALCTVLGFWCKYRSSDCCNGNAVPRVDNGVSNRPFPNYLWPLFQSESWCLSFHMKISFHLHVNQN